MLGAALAVSKYILCIPRIQLVSTWYPLSMVPSRGGEARPEARGGVRRPAPTLRDWSASLAQQATPG